MTSHEITAQITQLEQRKSEIQTRAAEREKAKNDLRRKLSRAVADGADEKVLAKMRQDVRALSDEAESVVEAVGMIDGDIRALERQRARTAADEAQAAYETAGRVAEQAIADLADAVLTTATDLVQRFEQTDALREAAVSAACEAEQLHRDACALEGDRRSGRHFGMRRDYPESLPELVQHLKAYAERAAHSEFARSVTAA